MKRIFTILCMLLLAAFTSFAQPAGLPMVEDFENAGGWAWSPWVGVTTPTSTKSASSAHSGTYGLSATGEWVYRTDVSIGTPGQTISWWVRFQGSGRSYCGFAATSAGCYNFCLAANTSTISIQNSSAWGFTDMVVSSQTFSISSWYRAEVYFSTTTDVIARLYASDGTTLLNTLTLSIAGLTPGGLAYRGFGPAEMDDLKAGTPASSSVPLPPIANFFPSQATLTAIPTDTVWINSPYDLVSTSTNTNRSFWDLPNENTLLNGYTRNAVAFTNQQYIDTVKYNQKFRYTFNRRGFWAVRLLAVNDFKRDSLRDSVVKYIWVDTPGRAPKPNFFSGRTKTGVGDYASFVDISTYGPNQWAWTFSPPCYQCSIANLPNTFAAPTDQNPLFFARDPGKFTICLKVWNARGFDSICKPDYIEVLNSFNVCGAGAVSSNFSQGVLFGAAGPFTSYTRTQVATCNGFSIEPCADSVYLFVDRIKMLPTDTLVIRDGNTATAPVLAKLGAGSLGQLPPAIITNGIKGGRALFIQYMTGTGTIPVPYDSAGFSIRWSVKPATYGIPQSKIIVPDTIFSLQPTTYTNNSTGTLMKYSWDSDGDGAYDSSGVSVTKTFLITTPQFKKICLVTYNCLGSDTGCKNVLMLPTSVKPVVRFTVDKVQGFNTDTFRFTDKSLYGPGQWAWTITGGAYQAIMGTVRTGNVVSSRDPIIRFTQRTKYTVKLVATNQYGSDSLIKVDYINIGAYDQPQCLQDISLADGSIGISRVALQNGIDTAVNSYSPCYQLIQGLQTANMYRGQKHVLTVVRPGTQSPMDRKAWIDFNMDGLFSNDELVMSDMNKTTLSRTDTIRLSNTQMLGGTRMRVGVTYAGTQLNPSVLFLGVFRDYNINFPKDTIRPTIALINTPVIYTEIHKAFVEPGVIASDNIEGDIASRLETIGTVDTSKVGPNYLKYIVRDLYGNVSDTLTRSVFVILNQTGPTITLNGSSSVYVEVYHKYTELGWVARDNQGTDISGQVIVTSNLDTARLGLYSRVYTIVDAFGFNRTAGRGITVGDTTRPWLLTPPGNIYIQQVGSAIDPGKLVTPKDNYWGADNLTLTWNGTVDVNNVGTYYVQYHITDQSGNIGDEVTIEIRVKDTRPPVIVLKGLAVVNVDVYKGFADPGYTVTDNYWPAGTISVLIKGTLNTSVLGSYKLWYVATDPSGNTDSVSREVRVVDMTKPVVNLLNVAEVNLPRWKEYVDPPVSLEDNYNTDAQMRTKLVVVNSLPKNAAGNYFGNSPGLYSAHYTVKDLSGNESDMAERIINVLPEEQTGILTFTNVDRLMSIYPNPSNGVFSIRLASAQQDNIELKVLDVTGKEIVTKTLIAGTLQAEELDLRGHAKGIYLLRVCTSDRIYTKRIEVN